MTSSIGGTFVLSGSVSSLSTRVCFAFILVTSSALAEGPPFLGPTLLPPRGEISPTFWEQHGWLVIIDAFIALIIITALVILLTRPRQIRIEAPEVVARRALEKLRSRADDDALLMEVSRVFRRYLVFAFDLPPEELTTGELDRTLQSSPKTEPALARDVVNFLRQCDQDKFSPPVVPPRVGVASRALELLEKIEAHRRQTFVHPSAA
jgi:hypothetical protein